MSAAGRDAQPSAYASAASTLTSMSDRSPSTGVVTARVLWSPFVLKRGAHAWQ